MRKTVISSAVTREEAANLRQTGLRLVFSVKNVMMRLFNVLIPMLLTW
jgi:hypothetical protein